MKRIFQVYNPKIGAWVKMKKRKGGTPVILDTKEKNPKEKFKL